MTRHMHHRRSRMYPRKLSTAAGDGKKEHHQSPLKAGAVEAEQEAAKDCGGIYDLVVRSFV